MTILSLDIDIQYKHLCCYSLLTLFCTASLLTLFCTYCSYLLCGFHFLKNINYHDLASCVSDTFWPQVLDILMSWSGSNIFVLLQILLFSSSFKVIKHINLAILCRMQNPLFAKVALKETPLTYSHILNLPFTHICIPISMHRFLDSLACGSGSGSPTIFLYMNAQMMYLEMK